LFENLIVLEALKTRFNQGLKPNLYFYRDSHGNELDLLYKSGNELHGIEIKSASTYTPSFKKGLLHFSENTHPLVKKTVIYTGQEQTFSDDVRFVSYKNVDTLFE
jgi:predicted AAA+ superfamily ATPase